MSLILEALKKSEAKRRLGEAPDLGTPFAAPRRRSPLVPIIVVVLIVGALVWWAMQRTSSTPAQNAAVPAAPAQSSGPQLHSVTGGNNLQQAPPPSNLAKAPSPPVQDPFTPSARADPNGSHPPLKDMRDRKRANARDRGDGPAPNAMASQAMPPNIPPPPAPISNKPTNVVVPPVNSAVAPSRPAAATATPPQVVATTPPPVVTPKTSDAAPPIAQIATRAPKTADTIGMPVTPPPAAQTSATKPAPSAQPYSELPFSVRKSLPELKLSMHVYVADPAQRFVILNSSRITEGDKTNDDVFVREIRPDGVVLEFQGQRFFYPRDGL